MNDIYVPNIQIQIHGNLSKDLADIIILDVHGAVGHNPKNTREQQRDILQKLKQALQKNSARAVYQISQQQNSLEQLPHYCGDPLLTLEWLQIAFESNDTEDLLDYLQLEHDFGIWKLTTATTKLLQKQAPDKKIIQIKVLQNRGIIDANRLQSNISVRHTFDHVAQPGLYQAMANYNLNVLSAIDEQLKQLSPTGFLFVPHSMNRVSKASCPDMDPDEAPGKLGEYVKNFSCPASFERHDMYMDEDEDRQKLGSAKFYEQLIAEFTKANKKLVANTPYRARQSISGTKYIKKHPRSACIEVRKDNLAILESPEQSYCSHLLTTTDPLKVQQYAQLYVNAILAV